MTSNRIRNRLIAGFVLFWLGTAIGLAAPVFGQDCVTEGPGSSIGQPDDCATEPEVVPTTIERTEEPGPTPPALPATGTNTARYAIVAITLIGLGVGAILIHNSTRP